MDRSHGMGSSETCVDLGIDELTPIPLTFQHWQEGSPTHTLHCIDAKHIEYGRRKVDSRHQMFGFVLAWL